MFKRILKWLLVTVAVILLAAGVFLVNLIYFRPWSLNLFYTKVFAQALFSEPEMLSSLGLVEQFGITSHNGKLSDESPAHQQAASDQFRKDQEQLQLYPLDRQTASQRLSTHVLSWFLQRRVEEQKFQFDNYPVNQLFGVQNDYPTFMATTHRLLAPEDCDYYLDRLNGLPKKFDQVLEGLKLRESRGVVPPRFVLAEVLTETRGFIGKRAAENILATSFKTRAAKIAALTAGKRADYQTRVEAAITGQVYPAYQKLIDFLQSQSTRATDDDGVWKLPDGAAYYAFLLRENTTTTMAPDEVHSLGLSEVTRIEAEMRTLLDANGFAGRPIGESMAALARDPRFLYPNDDAGRAQMLADYKKLLDQATERCAPLFFTKPKAICEVRRVPEFKEATAPAAYYEGAALDGTRPGVFYANLRDLNSNPKWSMPTLAYHEGVPGHHWQISTAQELKDLPQFRTVIPFTAYAEGWALYCEWMAKDAGWYANDPYGDLGRLQAELFRAVRLVVDTGIHAKRWTRAQAIAYMRDKTGMDEKEVTAEIERYIVMPAQACAYKVGMLKIQQLRKRAEDQLGAKFDVREFHDAVLNQGALPLEILEENVNAYIDRRKNA